MALSSTASRRRAVGHRLVDAGGDRRRVGPGRPCAGDADHERGRVEDALRTVVLDGHETGPPRARRAPGQRLELDDRLGLVADPVAAGHPRGQAVEQPADAGGDRAAPGLDETGHRALIGLVQPHRDARGLPPTRPPCATARGWRRRRRA